MVKACPAGVPLGVEPREAAAHGRFERRRQALLEFTADVGEQPARGAITFTLGEYAGQYSNSMPRVSATDWTRAQRW